MGYKVKRIMVWDKQVYPGKKVQTFDFQNNWSLNWTTQTIYWTPSYTSWQWWSIGSSTSTYQSAIMPPSSIYSGTLCKVKIWFYKWLATGRQSNVGSWLATSNFTNWLTSWCQPSGTSTNTYAYVYDWSNHYTQTTDITWEVIQEWILNDDWSITLSLNWGTPYNLWNYATLFRNSRSNKSLWLSIGRWDYSSAPYIRKVEITTIG